LTLERVTIIIIFIERHNPNNGGDIRTHIQTATKIHYVGYFIQFPASVQQLFI